MDADGLLELLDVLGSAFSKGSLGLTVALLAFLRCSVDLSSTGISMVLHKQSLSIFRFGVVVGGMFDSTCQTRK